MIWDTGSATNVPEKHHSMQQPIVSPAQLLPSNLENKKSSQIPSNFMNPDNNQELEVNQKGCSRDKVDVTNFISLTPHLRSIYFYFTDSNTVLYPISMSKEKNENKDD